ncbi:divalent-cation tolerance protein CutA [Pirellulaceae bacterium SH449]
MEGSPETAEYSIIQLFTTLDTRESADRVARALVEERLAACVQIDGPICSTYSWQGTIEESTEFRLTVKTCRSKLESLLGSLKKQHPYETPEILWFEVSASEAYTKWLLDYLR